jgi:hypothetical protein
MRYALTVIVIALLLSTTSAHSDARDRLRGEVSIEVVSDQGDALVAIPHKDSWSKETRIVKKYLVAKRGETYGIVIRNNTRERIGVVVAVDGRNIISGKKSDLKSGEDMYVVDSYGQGRYDGWRTDKDTVHRFYFTDPGDSYSKRTFDDETAMGVIAVAVYREKDRPLPHKSLNKREQAPGAPSSRSMSKDQSPAVMDEAAGTGFGEGQYSPVVRVAFEPEPAPAQKTLIKYDWRETLCRKGILRCGRETGNRMWDEDGYAPYPPGYERN